MEVGVILYVPHPRALLGQEQKINVWIADRKGNWNIDKGTGDIDLAILTAYKLRQNWAAEITLISVVDNPEDRPVANRFLRQIVDLARLPITKTLVIEGVFEEVLHQGPYADINIFPIGDRVEMDYFSQAIHHTNTSCLFIQDSGHENILA